MDITSSRVRYSTYDFTKCFVILKDKKNLLVVKNRERIHKAMKQHRGKCNSSSEHGAGIRKKWV